MQKNPRQVTVRKTFQIKEKIEKSLLVEENHHPDAELGHQVVLVKPENQIETSRNRRGNKEVEAVHQKDTRRTVEAGTMKKRTAEENDPGLEMMVVEEEGL